ncbi:MAG: hypothetical protein QOJ19_4306 [Acidimicrobiia bacterium]|nr:hypothetical protein [Acidimicrobiia bacterium]
MLTGLNVPVEQVLAFRARASHLDAKLAAGSYAQATHAGLQDSIPRAGLIGLHARIEGVQPSDWNHPSLCQIWFRGGADYIIPRADIAPFTLGTLPRDPVRRAAIDHAAARVVEFLAGRELKTRDVTQGVGFPDHMAIRQTSRSGRVLIRWNASTIFAYECERPDVDEEDARLELCRRFLRWFGPQTVDRFRWWTGLEAKDAAITWGKLRPELVLMEFAGESRMILEADLDRLRAAEPLSGVRLVQNDDPWLKLDRPLHVPDKSLHDWLFPTSNNSRGYAANAVVVDGTIAGVWQRQQRKVTIHPWRRLSRNLKAAIEQEALSFPIRSNAAATVAWEER